MQRNSKDRRERIEVLRGLRAWRAEVREKRVQWRLGDREVVFPRGTYGLGVFHGAKVEGVVRPEGMVRPDASSDAASGARPPPRAA